MYSVKVSSRYLTYTWKLLRNLLTKIKNHKNSLSLLDLLMISISLLSRMEDLSNSSFTIISPYYRVLANQLFGTVLKRVKETDKEIAKPELYLGLLIGTATKNKNLIRSVRFMWFVWLFSFFSACLS